jgi:hypothetical protein
MANELLKLTNRIERALRNCGHVVYHPSRMTGWQVIGVRFKNGECKVKVRGDEWYSVEAPSQISIAAVNF